MRIPDHKIDEVRNATDIVDVIGSFVKLKKRGKNFIGLCPFHTEKTPSFNVSPERQMFHCFGCGVGGSVFTFLMEYEKVSFFEAVRSLAEKAGITLPRYESDVDTSNVNEELYRACQVAGRFFYQSMMDSPEGKIALQYFRKRGFTEETIKQFGLGYSPNGWDALIKHADSENLSQEILEQAGLVRKKEDGTYYDAFRGRAMFPIFSTTGRVIGFGARKLREDDPLGKYINSPETPIYQKSRVLYGLFQSKESIRENDFAILVEGYADLITVYQAGVKNVVASSGTALTQEQIQLIGRYTKNVTIVYDADSAGSKAAMRGVDLILTSDMDVNVAPLPEGEDPDSFVKREGGEAFRKLLGSAESFIDFIAQSFERKGKLDSPEGQAETVRYLVQTIAKVPDELKRNFYIKHVAEKYRLYESTLYRELEKHLGKNASMRQRDEQIAATSTRAVPILQNELVDVPKSGEFPVAERDLLHAMLDGGNPVVKFVFDHVQIDDFIHPSLRDLALHLLHRMEEGANLDPALLINELHDPQQQRLVSDLIFSKYQLSKGWGERGVAVEEADPQKVAADAILALKRRAVDELIEQNLKKLKAASARGDNTTEYLEWNQELMKKKKELG